MEKTKSIDIEEFKALINLIPTTLKQAEWICSTAERLTREHPELKELCKMPESERREIDDFINSILAEAEE